MPAHRSWKWTAKRRQCLELFLAGASRRQIARQIGVDRGTVNRIACRSEFQAEAHRRCVLRYTNLRRRRSRQTESLCERVYWLAVAAIEKAESGVGNLDGEFDDTLKTLKGNRKTKVTSRSICSRLEAAGKLARDGRLGRPY